MNFGDQIFEPGFAMQGIHLVAASAGTGKTYSIQTLYLRLVLVEEMTVQQILVVTFTKAATKELRERLQKVLRQALDALEDRDANPEPRVAKMLALAEARDIGAAVARPRLAQALLDFDLAAIYTIHGFCQRMLGRFAFETGQPFDTEPAEDSEAEIVERCRDWWRAEVVAKGVESPGFAIDQLVAYAKRFIGKPDARAGAEDAAAQAARAVAAAYRAGRGSAPTVTFDDYLLNLREALRADGEDGPLHAALRGEFHAALIDEFQDTDPVQWGIFSNLFGSRLDAPCFLVGDPKQAIYRFRNGDIETYLRATAKIPEARRHVLDTNYRSEARLIAAVNQLFMDRPRAGSSRTFGHDAIPYDTPLLARGKKLDQALTVNGAPDERPFKLRLIEHAGAKKIVPGPTSGTGLEALRLVGAAIAELLADNTVRVAGEPVRPGHIAVLVHRHSEASQIVESLRAHGVPAIRQATGSVWASDEARQCWTFLQAVLNPQNTPTLRAALLTPWCGLCHRDLLALNAGEAVAFAPSGGARALEDWVVAFETWRETWRRRGFPAMFEESAEALGLRPRLAVLPDGLRRLTNIAHLAERLQSEIEQGRKSPEAALAWFQSQLADPRGGEEDQVRMDSDDDAVRIMTVFASKGLEFPIVFAPTLFMLKPGDAKRKLFEYHDDATGDLVVTQDRVQGLKLEDREVEIEHARHIYVALTRAVHRTVLFALATGKFVVDDQPLQRLLVGATATQADADAVFGAAADTPCAIELIPPAPAPEPPAYCAPAFEVGPPPEHPDIDTSRGHGSFSSLAPHGEDDGAVATARAADAAKNRDGETGAEKDAETVAEFSPADIFAFPAGAKTGTCWHEIFEEIPFAISDASLRDVVAEKLEAYGFLARAGEAKGRLAATFGMVRRVLDQSLPTAGGAQGGFTLRDVADSDRLSEWEFNFPTLPDRRTPALKAAIARHDRYRSFTDAVGAWDCAIPGGNLVGFIDLLFRHDGRYYIVDWKSNRRGGRQTDFGADGVREEIGVHGYWLQFLIYTVALHQHLRATLPGYDYDRHFGGVYYLFLRGIDGRGDGVYADRPPLALVEELSGILGDFK